jgi:hypothetical protein
MLPTARRVRGRTPRDNNPPRTTNDEEPSSATGYEFTPAQDLIIRTTLSRARTWRILTLTGGGLTALTGLLALLTGEEFGN